MDKKYKIFIVFLLFISLIYIYIYVNKEYKSIYIGTEQEFNCIIKNISYDEDKVKLTLYEKEKLIGTYYLKENEKLDLKLNDKIKVIGKLEKPNSNTIPNTFDYRKYLYNNQIFYTIKISKIEKISNNSNIFYKIKNNIISSISNYKSSSYLYTFILGNNDYIDSDINNSYQLNGINHLFSVSGMHVSFLSSIIIFLLKKINKKDVINYIIVSLFLLFYMFLVDFTPSTNRSVILYILISIKKVFNINIETLYLLIIDFIILIFINPFYIYNIGFIYSFTITFYLILLNKKLKSDNYFVSIFKVSIVAFIVGIPISLYNFYQINIMSVFYNLIFVPLISLIIFPLSFIVYIFPILDNLYIYVIDIVNNLSLWLSSFNTNLIFVIPIILIIIIYYILITLMFYKKKVILLFIIFLLLHYNYNLFYKNSFITFIDVGQGDSILIYSNNEVMLVDTGNKNEYLNNNIITYLKSLGIRKVNFLVLSHGDMDHLGNSEYLINNFKIDKLYINNNYVNENEETICKLKNCDKFMEKESIKLGNFNIVNLNKSYSDENDSSVILYLTINNYKILFMGDASIKSEEYILGKYNLENIDILKVGHHGSRTSTGLKFINELKPKYSVISVGKNNRYKHPNKEVLDNLNKSKIYRTDFEGSIIFKFKNKKLKIETCSP